MLGVPFDKTSSFRQGTAEAPSVIREASYCFEPFMMEYGVDLSTMPFHDMGDIVEYSPEDMGPSVKKAVRKILDDEKFPIILGGEHSITPHAVSAYTDELSVLILDAHLDHRDTYEGMKNSHATASRRVSEIASELLVCGVRSISSDEMEEGVLPPYLTSFEVNSWDDPVKKISQSIKGNRIYLSVDMDVVDPAYAPGVGNPEPFGLEPLLLKGLIRELSPRLVGFDIMEVSPPYDPAGITSNLAARLVYEILGSKLSSVSSSPFSRQV